MSISAISSGSSFQMGGSNPMAQMKQNFDDLGSALSSGNLDDAKKAFTKLQSNAPSGGDSKNPMSSEIDSLKKALDSGDLKGAQEAYSKIQDKMSKMGPPAGGPPQGAPTDTVQLSSQASAKSTTSDTKTYDKKDSNKDGTVSSAEELAYDVAHPNGESSTTVEKADTTQAKAGVQTYA
jgi:soluble cytochrome b562